VLHKDAAAVTVDGMCRISLLYLVNFFTYIVILYYLGILIVIITWQEINSFNFTVDQEFLSFIVFAFVILNFFAEMAGCDVLELLF